MSTLTAEERQANIEWAKRGDFSTPRSHGFGAEGLAENHALLEAAGVDVDALYAARGVGRPRLATDEETESLTFRTTKTQAQEVRSLAAHQGRGLAAIMRDALTQYLTNAAA